MLKKIKLSFLTSCFALTICFAVPVLSAQTAAPAQTSANAAPKFYDFNFTVREMEDDTVLSYHHYSILNTAVYPAGTHAQLPGKSVRVNTRVPVTADGSLKIEYLDLGVEITCTAVEQIEDRISMGVHTKIAQLEQGTAHSDNPVILQNNWDNDTSVVIGKPTVLFSVHQPGIHRRLQLEITVVPTRQP